LTSKSKKSEIYLNILKYILTPYWYLLGPEISNVKATDVTKEAATLSWDQVTGLAPLGANGEIAYKVCPKDPASTETCKEGTVAGGVKGLPSSGEFKTLEDKGRLYYKMGM